MVEALREIVLEAPDVVHRTLASLGRTEDVRLAPGGRRLAIACYGRGAIAVGDVEVAPSAGAPTVRLTRLEILSSPLLEEPHGLDWQDDDTLVVANRAGHLSVLRIAEGELVEVSSTPTDAPGSVALTPVGGGGHAALVCGNWNSVVTRFELDAVGILSEGGPTLRRWLDLPDGIAAGGTGRWLAVSNHNTHTVLVFDRATAREDADPVAVLRGVDYPHGLRFAVDDRVLLVADAGAPNVHLFATADANWAVGAAFPAATVRVLDEPTFARGHRNPTEGGPKGIEVDARSGVMLVTCEELPLGVFDASELLRRPGGVGTDSDGLLRHELAALASAAAERKAVATARANLAAMMATKAWRLTAPVRRLHEALRHAKRRRPHPEVSSGRPPVVSD